MSGTEGAPKPSAAAAPRQEPQAVQPSAHAPIYPSAADRGTERGERRVVDQGYDGRYHSSRYYPSSHAVLDDGYVPGRVIGRYPDEIYPGYRSYVGDRYASGYAPRYLDNGYPLSASVIRSRRLYDPYALSVPRIAYPGYGEEIIPAAYPRYAPSRYVDAYPRVLADDYHYPLAPARAVEGGYYDYPRRYDGRYLESRYLDRPYGGYGCAPYDPYETRLIDSGVLSSRYGGRYAAPYYSDYPGYRQGYAPQVVGESVQPAPPAETKAPQTAEAPKK